MSTKETIKCLTLSAFLLPSLASGSSVKDIINNYQAKSLVLHQELEATIHQWTFEENKDDNRQVVVIDAGHGGHDPGTHGKHSQEKEIALEIALKLGKQLAHLTDDIEIIYTRKTDVFIPLHKRIGLANKKKADLFVSIHCNYVGNPHVCGTETFVMGLHRAEENLSVAKRENSSILLENEYESHYEGYDPNSPVGHILLSTFQNVFIDNSIDLASKVESRLLGRKNTKSRGVKQAGFVVLRQATMPSILIETGFLSNAKEEKYLLSQAGQDEMATGIGNGIIDYFGAEIKAPQTQHAPKHTAKVQKDNDSHHIGSKAQYIIQVGVFSKKKDKAFESKLAKHGTVIIEPVGSVFRYTVGYFESKSTANTALSQLKKDGFGDGYIKNRR